MGKERNRYFIAVVPPPPVYESAHALKEHFRDEYNSKAALNSPPHITLHMPFLWSAAKEEELISKLSAFARQRDPVEICLDNFSSFPPRVIFINVTDGDALRLLQRELHGFMKRELGIFNANHRDTPFHPHLTLAFRDLRKEQYHKAWRVFAEREFKAAFIADRVVLLKHNGRHWDVFREFMLESTTYSTEANPELKATEG